MATKRRKIPPAVQEQLNRRLQSASTLARRQSAALGKSARERLKPLLEAAKSDADEYDAAWDKAREEFAQALRNVTITPKWTLAPSSIIPSSNWFGTVSFDFGALAPTIDSAKLDALKGIKPCKVPMRIPDMMEVITAWRGWTLHPSGRLGALGQSRAWPAREALQAECMASGGHIAPAWSCNCGIWAFKDMDKLVEAIGSSYVGVKVLGAVSLWGRVIETENGYRAQYAYPSELWLLDDSLEELGLIYDVPIRMAGK